MKQIDIKWQKVNKINLTTGVVRSILKIIGTPRTSPLTACRVRCVTGGYFFYATNKAGYNLQPTRDKLKNFVPEAALLRMKPKQSRYSKKSIIIA